MGKRISDGTLYFTVDEAEYKKGLKVGNGFLAEYLYSEEVVGDKSLVATVNAYSTLGNMEVKIRRIYSGTREVRVLCHDLLKV